MKAKETFLKLVFLAAILFTGCNSGKEKKESGSEGTAEPKEQIVKAPEESTAYKAGDQLPNELVCMVNDAYMAKPQIPVEVNGKTYYGCCNMCVTTLNEKETARLATDPATGGEVDKSEAYIVLLNQNGKVAYFESEKTYNSYLEAGN